MKYNHHLWDANVDHVPINLYSMWSFTGTNHENIRSLDGIIKRTNKINPKVNQLIEGIRNGKAT